MSWKFHSTGAVNDVPQVDHGIEPLTRGMRGEREAVHLVAAYDALMDADGVDRGRKDGVGMIIQLKNVAGRFQTVTSIT